MKNSRSRTENEKDLELNITIQARTIDNLMKRINSTQGRKTIVPYIKDLENSIILLNDYFQTYKKSMMK